MISAKLCAHCVTAVIWFTTVTQSDAETARLRS
jgi:hypothetical protein